MGNPWYKVAGLSSSRSSTHPAEYELRVGEPKETRERTHRCLSATSLRTCLHVAEPAKIGAGGTRLSTGRRGERSRPHEGSHRGDSPRIPPRNTRLRDMTCGALAALLPLRADRSMTPRRPLPVIYLPCAGVAAAACSMTDATTSGLETKMAWLPSASVTVAPARFAIDCWRGGGIILSAVDTK